MAKTYVDEIVGGDGKRRYNLVRDDGSMAAQNVQIVKAYTPEQEGSTFGAVDVYDLQCKEYTVTLTADGWVDGQQTVSLPEIQADAGTVFVGLPAEATLERIVLVGSLGLRCIGRGSGSLIFECLLGAPSIDIDINVVLTGGQTAIVNAIGGIGGDSDSLYVVEEITASKQWTVPQGVTEIEVRLFGGGGGGSGGAIYASGGGGGGGHMAFGTFTVTPGTTYQITIGAGGQGISNTEPAYAGGTTTFGSLLSADGGQGGSEDQGGDGGTGGGGSSYWTSSIGASGFGAYGGCGGGLQDSIRRGVYGGYPNSIGWESMPGKTNNHYSDSSAQDKAKKAINGGGGYYANGGNANIMSIDDEYGHGCGGGGGWMGGNGGNGGGKGGGGGGGYGPTKLAGDAGYGGGKGGYGYGAGGGGASQTGTGGNGAPGICIIKYRKF